MNRTRLSTHLTALLAHGRPLAILLAMLVLLLLDAGAPGTTAAQAPDVCALLPPGASEAKPFPPETPGCVAGYPTGKIWKSGEEVRVGVAIALYPTAETARASLPDCKKWGTTCTPTDVGDIGFEIDMSTSFQWDANAVRGCYSFGVGVQYGAPAQSWANGIVVPETGDRALVDQARKIFRQIDAKLKSVPPCLGAAQPPTGRFGVGHGCSYNEPAISPGQLRCHLHQRTARRRRRLQMDVGRPAAA